MRQNRVHLMPPMSNFYARICVKATPSSNSDAQWEQLRNSKNELNRDGAEYDAAVNWPQQEAA